MNKTCSVCGHPYSEEHHIIFRSQQPAMVKSPLNIMLLCHSHHRGSLSPHMTKKIDIKYKKGLQSILEKKFSYKNYFTEDEVKEILKIPIKDARSIVKTLKMIVREGQACYESSEIIKQALGGRFYK